MFLVPFWLLLAINYECMEKFSFDQFNQQIHLKYFPNRYVLSGIFLLNYINPRRIRYTFLEIIKNAYQYQAFLDNKTYIRIFITQIFWVYPNPNVSICIYCHHNRHLISLHIICFMKPRFYVYINIFNQSFCNFQMDIN